MKVELIKKNRTYQKDVDGQKVDVTVTEVCVKLPNGYAIAITPKFKDDKRDWRDLYMLAEVE